MSSDRGNQFTSSLWDHIGKLFGTKLHRTTAYHPQSNGLVERFHRQLKSSLKARLTGPDWLTHLPWVLLGIRTMPKEDLGASSAELVYGQPLTVPGDFLQTVNENPTSSNFLKQLREIVDGFVPYQQPSNHRHNQSYVPKDLMNSKFVFIRREKRNPLQNHYDGPYRVLQHGEKYFTVDIGGRSEIISLDRLKQAYLNEDEPVIVAEPPRRGRPRKGVVNEL